MEQPQQSNVSPVDRYPIMPRDLVVALIIGALVGALGWLINLFLQQYFVEPVFCASPDSFGACQNGGTIAWALAHLLVVGASVVVMVRFAIYRPLLVALAVLATVWGINSWLGGLSWWDAMLWQALIFGLGYGTYAWIARIRQFWLAAVVAVIVIVLCRLVLTWA